MDNNKGFKKHLPNILTSLRLFLFTPALYAMFIYNFPSLAILSVFVVGALTDFADGFLARKWDVQSKYGHFVDPIADKLFNGSMLGLVGFCINPAMLSLLVIELFILATTGLRGLTKVISKKDLNKELNVSLTGKIKTWLIGASMVSTMLLESFPSLAWLPKVAEGIMYTTLCFQGVTLSQYGRKFISDVKALIKPENIEESEVTIEQSQDLKDKTICNQIEANPYDKNISVSEHNEIRPLTVSNQILYLKWLTAQYKGLQNFIPKTIEQVPFEDEKEKGRTLRKK